MRIKPLFLIHVAIVGFCGIIMCWLDLGRHIWEKFFLRIPQRRTWVSFVLWSLCNEGSSSLCSIVAPTSH